MINNNYLIASSKDCLYTVLHEYYKCFREIVSIPFLLSELYGEPCDCSSNQEDIEKCCAMPGNVFRNIVCPILTSNKGELDQFIQENQCHVGKLKWERKFRTGDEEFDDKYNGSHPQHEVEICKLLVVSMFTQQYNNEKDSLNDLIDVFNNKKPAIDQKQVDLLLKHLDGNYCKTDEHWLILLDQSLILYTTIFKNAYNSIYIIRKMWNPMKHASKKEYVV